MHTPCNGAADLLHIPCNGAADLLHIPRNDTSHQLHILCHRPIRLLHTLCNDACCTFLATIAFTCCISYLASYLPDGLQHLPSWDENIVSPVSLLPTCPASTLFEGFKLLTT